MRGSFVGSRWSSQMTTRLFIVLSCDVLTMCSGAEGSFLQLAAAAVAAAAGACQLLLLPSLLPLLLLPLCSVLLGRLVLGLMLSC